MSNPRAILSDLDTNRNGSVTLAYFTAVVAEFHASAPVNDKSGVEMRGTAPAGEDKTVGPSKNPLVQGKGQAQGQGLGQRQKQKQHARTAGRPELDEAALDAAAAAAVEALGLSSSNFGGGGGQTSGGRAGRHRRNRYQRWYSR